MNAVNSILDFFSKQLLGMKWLNDVIGLLVKLIFGEAFAKGRWGLSLQFFIYDFIKIGILLCLLIFIISYVQSFFPPERTKRILSKYKGIKGNILGALLGTVTPFCSCSSIPLFIGFTRAGLSSGITFSFLISSPLVDFGAFVLLVSAFGFPIALTYVVVGLILAVVGGTLIEKSGLGNEIEDFVKNGNTLEVIEEEMTFKDRLVYSKNQVTTIYKKVVLYIAIGVGIGALIHNWIPQAWIETVLGMNNPFSVIIATLVGTPMYADIFGTIPIAEALYAKGVGLGTILSFMMSVTALSLPSLILLKRVIKPKLLLTFFLVVVGGIILIGYLFNALGFLFI
jgi:uncharacterized membrane protein YraQ (UPF0718 family)